MRLRIRPSLVIYKKNQFMDFTFTNTEKTSRYEVGDEIVTLVHLLDGSLDVEEIYHKLSAEHPEIDRKAFNEIIDAMLEDDLLEAVDKGKEFLGQDDLQRYKRQIQFFEEFMTPQVTTYEIQKKLMDSRIAVFGLGGTGSWIVQTLAQAGVGHIKIFDFDVVDISNLSRQAIYQPQHVGQKKHLVVKTVLESNNPKIQVESFELRLTSDINISTYIHDVDLVINCTDFPNVFTTSMWISLQCMELNKPHIVAGGYRANKGMIGPTIIPYVTACWKCYEHSQTNIDEEGELIQGRNYDYVGSINVIGSIIANIQAWDAIRVLIGAEPIVTNKRGYINFRDLSIHWLPFERNNSCPICGRSQF